MIAIACFSVLLVGLLAAAYAQGGVHERQRWEHACDLVVNEPPVGVGAERVPDEHRKIAIRAVHALALRNYEPPRRGAA